MFYHKQIACVSVYAFYQYKGVVKINTVKQSITVSVFLYIAIYMEPEGMQRTYFWGGLASFLASQRSTTQKMTDID